MNKWWFCYLTILLYRTVYFGFFSFKGLIFLFLIKSFVMGPTIVLSFGHYVCGLLSFFKILNSFVSRKTFCFSESLLGFSVTLLFMLSKSRIGIILLLLFYFESRGLGSVLLILRCLGDYLTLSDSRFWLFYKTLFI